MKVYHKISDCVNGNNLNDFIITLGNFDGLHLGHQFLLKKLSEEAKKSANDLIVITFDPHPVEIFAPDKKNFLIYPYETKIDLLHSQGINNVVVLKFDRDFSMLSAHDFLEKIIYEDGRNIKLKKIILGYDFLFGSGRDGDYNFAKNFFKNKNIEVEQLNEFPNIEVSSTKIREAISRGEIEEANKMLGREFSMSGLIIKGDGRGKKIGIPTANIDINSRLIFPCPGVYITKIDINGLIYNSITNVGVRPTFENTILNVETHIFDFDLNIYGENIKILFLKKLRDEIKFPSVNDLISQIKSDIQSAKKYVHPELS